MVENQKRANAGSAVLYTLLFAIVFIAISVSLTGRSNDSPPAAERGVLCLRDWSLQDDGKVPLTGEWSFHWKKLLDAREEGGTESRPGSYFVQVPNAWTSYNLGGIQPDRQGYATYGLRIELGETTEVLAIHIPALLTAYVMYADGEVIAESGKVSDNESDAAAFLRPQTVYFKPASDTIQLTVQLSNYMELDGGMTQALELGSGVEMGRLRERELGGAMFFLGSSLVLALYYLYSWFVRRFVKEALYFGVLCSMTALRMLVTDQLFILHIVPGLNIEWLRLLEAISLLAGALTAVLFIRQLFPEEFNQTVARLQLVIGTILGLPMLAGAMYCMPYFRTVFLWYLTVIGMYFFYILILAAIRKREGAGVRLAAMLVNLFAVIHDYLLNQGADVLFDKPILYYTAFIHIFVEATDFSNRFPYTRPLERQREPVALPRSQEFILLIADADCCRHRMIRNSLSDERYRLLSTMNGEDTLHYIQHADHPDLILIDFMIPGVTALELVRRIRRMYSREQLPIIMMIEKEQSTTAVTQGFEAGVNDFMIKPFLPSEIKARFQLYMEMKQLAEAAASSELAVLQAEIKPHFLYNTLNTILSLTLEQPRRAHELLENLSYFLRNSMLLKDAIKLISFNEEMELVKAYLFIESARYGSKLQIEYDIDESLSPCIPPFIVQPIVENAVKHGIIPSREGGKVKITAKADQSGAFCIMVEDNGIGIPPDKLAALLDANYHPTQSMALMNIHQRLQRIYGHGLSIYSEEGIGTRVVLHIPDEWETS